MEPSPYSVVDGDNLIHDTRAIVSVQSTVSRIIRFVFARSILSFSILLLILAIAFQSITIRLKYQKAIKHHHSSATPPTWPYLIPILGPIMTVLSYLLSYDPVHWILNTSVFQQSQPIQVDVLHKQFYIVNGRKNVRDAFKNSWTCTQIFLHKFTLGRVFGMSPSALRIYDQDNSGYRIKPRPDTFVDPHNRIDHLTFSPITKFLSGSGMWAFWKRYEVELADQLNNLAVDTDWVTLPDLTALFEVQVSTANTNALCGKALLEITPNFLTEVWKLDRNLDLLFRGTPRFLAPRVYACRDRLINAVEKWQDHARQHFDAAHLDQNGDDPFWGSRVFRDRNAIFAEMDGMTNGDMASEDFGVIWSSTRNSVVAGLWTVLQVFSDAELLSRVRTEIEPCRTDTGFDIDRLLKLPLLQSIYAEVLRMRVHMLITRIPQYANMQVQDWAIPVGKMAVMSTTVAHMDPEAWNTGLENEHPLNTFWADRFLVHDDQGNTTFTTKNVDGAWFPYGGGPRMCPGRHFAKRDIMFTTATLITLFDMEILVDVSSLEMDMRGFGLGTMAVKGAIPFRIRRR